MTEQEEIEQLLIQARQDAQVLGVLILGSRGKGFANEFSDFDVLVIVQDEKLEEVRLKYEKKGRDIGLESLTTFSRVPPVGLRESWDRYDFTHTEIPIDKTGDITRLAMRRGTLAPEESTAFIREQLDGYVNALFRSVKCFRSGNESGMKLEAVSSIPLLLDVLFALDQRPRPFWSYLEKELQTYPLGKSPWNTETLLENIFRILATGDVPLQQRMHREMQKLLVAEGFGDIYKEWEGKDEWAMTYVRE